MCLVDSNNLCLIFAFIFLVLSLNVCPNPHLPPWLPPYSFHLVLAPMPYPPSQVNNMSHLHSKNRIYIAKRCRHGVFHCASHGRALEIPMLHADLLCPASNCFLITRRLYRGSAEHKILSIIALIYTIQGRICIHPQGASRFRETKGSDDGSVEV